MTDWLSIVERIFLYMLAIYGFFGFTYVLAAFLGARRYKLQEHKDKMWRLLKHK